MPEKPPVDSNGELQDECRACGAMIPHASRYCPACGAYLNPASDIVQRLNRSKEQWNIVKQCIVFYVVYLSTLLPIAWLPEEYEARGIIVVSFVDAAIILFFLWRSGIPLKPLFIPSRRIIFWITAGSAALVPLLALNFGYHAALFELLQVEEIRITDPFTKEGFGFGWIIFAICIMPAVWEELAFRGILQFQLTKVIGKNEALLITAVLFAIIHCSLFSAPYLLLVGLFLGKLRELSGSLTACMIAHFLHNLVVVSVEVLYI